MIKRGHLRVSKSLASEIKGYSAMFYVILILLAAFLLHAIVTPVVKELQKIAKNIDDLALQVKYKK